MKLYTTIRRLILSGILLVGNAVNAQIFVMQNAQTIEIDACENPSGIIYDDGGPTADYANNFDGYIIIRASAGLTINLSGTYFTESCCDRLTIQDGTTTLVDEVGGSDSVNVSSTTGQIIIRFHTDGSVVSSGFELSWNVTGISAACANPVSELDTLSVSPTSITLSWTAPNSAGPFTVVCGDQTFRNITTR